MKKNESEIRWYVVVGDEPTWERAAALDSDNIVYMPAAACGHEAQVLLMISWDGNYPAIYGEGHLYVPCDWVIHNYPALKELALKIQERVTQYSKGDK